MKKRIISAAVFFCLIFAGVSYAGQTVKITVDGKVTNTGARLIDGRVYVDALAFSEAVGLKTSWDQNTGTVAVSSSSNDVAIPEIIRTVSPCVVGIIGNVKEELLDDYSKYSEGVTGGTGVIIKSDGEILTNAHVIDSMDRIAVVLSDGNAYEAELQHIDEAADLAVIKIEKTGLPTAVFGSSDDIVPGKTVIAIGMPAEFSLRNSASAGIISGVNRNIGSTYKMIQTDAAINPGNSGGPLVNLKGQVIGINSSKYVSNGVESLGFSITVDTVRYVLGHFDKYGRVKRPYLGATFEEDWAARYGLPSASGLLLKEIAEGSPADEQGLKENDTLISVGGTRINTVVDFNEEMKKYLPDSNTMLKFKRNGVVQNLNIKLGEE